MKVGKILSLFVIGDLHLSLGTDKPMDIFDGWKDYQTKISNNWKNNIEQDDVIVIAGDISWALKLQETYKDFNFINNLPGKKIILKGNHDLWFDTKSKVERYLKENNFNSISILFNNYYEYESYILCGTRGWINDKQEAQNEKIINREAGRLEISLSNGIKTGKEPIVFLHYPPIYNGIECEEILNVLKRYNVKKCFYGHLHSKSCDFAFIGDKYGINFQLISSDYLQFKPFKIM